MTDSPSQDNLQFLSNVTVTASHAFIRWHGRNAKHRYNYLYSKDELRPWVPKVKKIQAETQVLRGYFNNHYGAKAVVNALEFREMLGEALSSEHQDVLEQLEVIILRNSVYPHEFRTAVVSYEVTKAVSRVSCYKATIMVEAQIIETKMNQIND